VRPLKTSGRLSKGRPLVLGNLAESHSEPGYMQPVDTEILKLLRGISSGSWPMVPVLTGALGHLALARMVATGRCHWQQQDAPALTQAEPRSLLMRWDEDADGFLNLTFNVGDGAEAPAGGPTAEILLTDPPSYLDPLRHTIGDLLTHGLRTAQLNELKRAPRLPQERAEGVSRLLLKEFPDLPLPTPTPVALTQITDAPAVPCLALHGGRGGADAHRLQLTFDYAGHRLSAHPPESHSVTETPDGLVDVSRDAVAEAAAAEVLAAHGFAPTDQGQPARGPLQLAAVGDDALTRAAQWSALLRHGPR
jgi:hypothetical protein